MIRYFVLSYWNIWKQFKFVILSGHLDWIRNWPIAIRLTFRVGEIERRDCGPHVDGAKEGAGKVDAVLTAQADHVSFAHSLPLQAFGVANGTETELIVGEFLGCDAVNLEVKEFN